MAEPKQIVPRNLTARATYQVAGNPSVTRPEDSVANCYPGLELDVRNFDRRFFPGLVFDFVARDDVDAAYSQPTIYGAKLRYLDYMTDPDLIDHPPPEGDQSPEAADWAKRWKLYNELQGDLGDKIGDGVWYIDWIEQSGKRLSMTRRDENGAVQPMDGLFVWRLVRSLEPGPLKLGLGRRDAAAPEVTIEGWRRQFADPETGILNGAFQPGELMQSLCSPWQHDFRDCACHYWASNHPDVVYGQILPGERTLPDQASADPERANTLLDWLRRDRTPGMEAAAENTIEQNRPYQFDHFEINQHWERLNIVLNDTEIDSLYVPPEEDHARPFDSPEQLATALRESLAPLEMALAIEYLYARFSLLSREEGLAQKERWPTLADDVTFIRHFILLTAVSEMQHLRWANQLLWELYDGRLIPSYEPVLQPAKWIPAATGSGPAGGARAQPAREPVLAGLAEVTGAPFKAQNGQASAMGWRWRERALRPLTPEALADFIAVEHPSGDIDLSYSRVVATLRLRGEYPDHMVEIAERIVKDGMDHFSRFRDIKGVLSTTYGDHDPPPYLRKIELGSRDDAREALELLEQLLDHLRVAYGDEAQGAHDRSSPHITAARAAMNRLLEVGEALAANGIGIPFWRG
jgi:hypothetical protein